MIRQHLKHALLISAVLLMSGCASSPSKNGGLSAAQSDTPNGIGGASIGELVSVTADDEFDASSVIVASEYTAASGRTCRRLQTSDGKSIPRVVCKDSKGNWGWARSLMPATKQASKSFSATQPNSQSATQVSEPVVQETESTNDISAEAGDETDRTALVVDGIGEAESSAEVTDLDGVDLEPGEFVVLPNETLWSFAKRTTGNALNWQRIAKLNDIDDARTITNGDILQVPVELVRDGD